MDEIIRMRHLTGGYPQKEIFQDLSFTIQKGTFVTLLGPNGSGKSTLLKFLYKELKPREGAIFLQGSDIQTMRQKQLASVISLVPQWGRIEYDFSVREAIEMGEYAGKGTKTVGEILELCELKEKEECSVLSLSGGEFQRTLIARSLMQGSQVMLLDEPVNNLDISSQISLMRLFRTLSEEGKTILCVLHDLTLAQVYGDEIILLSEGKIVAQGDPSSVLTKERMEEVYHCAVQKLYDPAKKRYLLSPVW